MSRFSLDLNGYKPEVAYGKQYEAYTQMLKRQGFKGAELKAKQAAYSEALSEKIYRQPERLQFGKQYGKALAQESAAKAGKQAGTLVPRGSFTPATTGGFAVQPTNIFNPNNGFNFKLDDVTGKYVPAPYNKKGGQLPKPVSITPSNNVLSVIDDVKPTPHNRPLPFKGDDTPIKVIDDIEFEKVKPNRFKQFLKGKGKYAVAALALAAVGTGIYALCKKGKKDDAAQVADNTTQPVVLPVTDPQNQIKDDTTLVVPPVVDEEPKDEVKEEPVTVVPVIDDETEEDVKEDPVKAVPVVELPEEDDEPVIISQEDEPIKEPIGLQNEPGGLTVAEMKGEITENRVENRYLRREIALSKAYERRIGAPNEEKPSIEEMQGQITFNKQENFTFRQEIKNVKRVERQERKLERIAQQNIYKLERDAKLTEKKLLKAAEKARKSGLEVNETKLEADISGLQKTTKKETTKISKQAEKDIAQNRLQLTA